MTDDTTQILPVAAIEVLQSVTHLQAIGLTEVNLQAVALTAHLVGVQLQGIPASYREATVARLRNFAERAGESVNEQIAAVIAKSIAAGWEHHSFNAEAKASSRQSKK